ncbi:hypothetical protein VNO77_29303 [Canavalia gladiata]|uniref:Uncharacterized protein n=1 Tax=Canavalia gladiata TaxID=3824 RepID=A0AAN9KZQ0_CANGL
MGLERYSIVPAQIINMQNYERQAPSGSWNDLMLKYSGTEARRQESCIPNEDHISITAFDSQFHLIMRNDKNFIHSEAGIIESTKMKDLQSANYNT